MKTVTSLYHYKYQRKYNDVVRKKLASAGIETKEIGFRGGWRLQVKPEDFSRANKIVLSVSYSNPQYR